MILVLAAAAMGLAASPHCLAMCGAPCATITGGDRSRLGAFLAGRLAAYAAGGAVAAASVALLAEWGRANPALRPLWLFVQLGFVMLGAWWLLRGRQPDALRAAGWAPVRFLSSRRSPWRSGVAGLAWIAWPCGALQGGLALAAVSGTPAEGAAAMAAFALASTPALGLAPWAWSRLSQRSPGAAALLREGAGLRIAGALLMAGSGWALARGLWTGVAGWCVT